MKKYLMTVALLILVACNTAAQPTPPSNTEPGIVKGIAVDGQGKPLAGVEVVANNTQFYNANIVGKTDAQGRYRLQLTSGSWQMTASYMREYNGQSYRIELTPDKDAAFAGTEGAVRNFKWIIGGEARQGSVFVYSDIGIELLDSEHIELTLVPQGPLLDGSTGKTMVGKLKSTPDGDGLTNIPLGRYKISARYMVPGEAVQGLEVKGRKAGDETYASTITADFESRYGTGLDIFWLELMVRRKGAD